MKRILFFCMSLLCMVGMTSCLNSSNNNNGYPRFVANVTLMQSGLTGTEFLSDNGAILVPTQEDLKQLGKLDELKRLSIAFDTTGKDQDATELKPGQRYDIRLNLGFVRYIPTKAIIDRNHNAAADSLDKHKDAITNLQAPYAVNGFVTATITLPFARGQVFYLNMAYDSSKDIDEANNKMTLTLYFNNHSRMNFDTGQALFSFALPEKEMHRFKADSVSVDLRIPRTADSKDYQVTTLKVARKDFAAPHL